MPTVKELIEEYGEGLVGRRVRWTSGDFIVLGIYWKCRKKSDYILKARRVPGGEITTFSYFENLILVEAPVPKPVPITTVGDLIRGYGGSLKGSKVEIEGCTGAVTRVSPGCGELEILTPDGSVRIFGSGCHADLIPTTKTPFELLDLGFAAAMCENWGRGVKAGRTADDWQHLPRTDETRDRYVAKILRHLQAYVEGKGSQHATAIACDANILWHIDGRGE